MKSPTPLAGALALGNVKSIGLNSMSANPNFENTSRKGEPSFPATEYVGSQTKIADDAFGGR